MATASAPRTRSLRRRLVVGITAAAALAALVEALLLNLVWHRYEDRLVDRIVVDQLRRSMAVHARDPALAYPNTDDLRLYVVPGDRPPEYLGPLLGRPDAAGPAGEIRMHAVDDAAGLTHRVGVARDAERVYVLSYDPAEHDQRLASLLASLAAIVALVVLASMRAAGALADRLLAGLQRLQRDVASGVPPAAGGRDELEIEVAALAEELDARSRQVAAALRKERAFAAAASHELRTPLTRIATGTDVLLALPDTPDATRPRLRSIREAADELQRLLDVLLQVARWQPGEDAGGAVDEPQRAIGEVIDACVARIEPEARAIGGSIVVSVDAPARPVAHPSKLDVVLGNLLRNAVRHGRGAPVELRVADGEVQVLDGGPGIDAATLERAFDPFWRGTAPAGEGGGPPGLGLGLTIAERICTVAGWRLSIEPREPRGTRARLRLADGRTDRG
ncbi:MAG TPA: HAMP domain-containing sensor histidine kinase [Burkholderiaceae bacterium]|nr:HAMP domain-containing sensor histidine kinase [Burkholderiaceae bacterium]